VHKQMFMLALPESCQAGQLFPPTLLMCCRQLYSRHVRADENDDVDITPVDCCLATSIARSPIMCCLLLVLLVVVLLRLIGASSASKLLLSHVSRSIGIDRRMGEPVAALN
jgi:hypothetical protein